MPKDGAKLDVFAVSNLAVRLAQSTTFATSVHDRLTRGICDTNAQRIGSRSLYINDSDGNWLSLFGRIRKAFLAKRVD